MSSSGDAGRPDSRMLGSKPAYPLERTQSGAPSPVQVDCYTCRCVYGGDLRAAGAYQRSSDPNIAWSHYGSDAFGTKYSPLAEVDRNNVETLRVVWSVRVGGFPPPVFDAVNHTTSNEHEVAVLARDDAPCRGCRFETTALMREGTLYLSTPLNRVLALDPSTGKSRWTFNPEIDITRSYAEDLTSRGVSIWTDDTAPSSTPCARRVFLAAVDARLFALDAADGKPCKGPVDAGRHEKHRRCERVVHNLR